MNPPLVQSPAPQPAALCKLISVVVKEFTQSGLYPLQPLFSLQGSTDDDS
jgi:hypothetical protein